MSNLLTTASNIPQPKIDATDRRQIEAQNEDKSHTTKEALDDIKRTHYKEKRKKEQNNMDPMREPMQSMPKTADSYALDPKVIQNLRIYFGFSK